MGFARLAENMIRSARGKKEGESLGALDKIASSTIGGALATWNQPIEVVRVEVGLERDKYLQRLRLCLPSDAISCQKYQPRPACQTDCSEHAAVRVQKQRIEGAVPWCHSSDWLRYLADRLHGLFRGLCQSLVRFD